MRKFLLVLAAIVFASNALAQDIANTNYTGRDAGHLVLAISHARSGAHLAGVALHFRKVDRSFSGFVNYEQLKLLGFNVSADFEEPDQIGAVIYRGLPPGDYEFFFFTGGPPTFRYLVRFSLPFTIKTGETTYLGDFRLFEIPSEGDGALQDAAGYYIVITDENGRDLEIARKKRAAPPLGHVTITVASAESLDVPLFRSEPAPVIVESAETARAYEPGVVPKPFEREPAPLKPEQYPEALERLTKAISAPDLWAYKKANAYNRRGIIFAAQKRYADAIADFSQAIAIDRFAYVAYSNRAGAYFITGEFDLAIADQTKLLSFFPEDKAIYLRRAGIYFVAGKLDLALVDTNEALRLDAKDAVAYARRAAIYRASGKTELAIADYSKAIGINLYVETVHEHYNARGFLYVATGEYEKALKDFDKILYNRTGTAENYAGRCLALVGLGMADRALKDCDKAISVDPKSTEALNTRGIAFLKFAQYPRAMEDFNAALRLDPRNPTSIYGLGLAKAKTGDVAGGNGDMDEALRMKPDAGAGMSRFGITR